MRIASTIGATALQHDGVDYEPDEAGLFEVPHEVGEALIRFPHWQQEWEALDDHLAAKAEQDRDPDVLAARVEALEAAHATLIERLEALEAALTAPDKADDGEAPAAGKPATAKRSRSKKAEEPADASDNGDDGGE